MGGRADLHRGFGPTDEALAVAKRFRLRLLVPDVFICFLLLLEFEFMKLTVCGVSVLSPLRTDSGIYPRGLGPVAANRIIVQEFLCLFVGAPTPCSDLIHGVGHCSTLTETIQN